MDQGWFVEPMGFVAGTLTTAAFLPQVIKSFRSGSTRDISLIMWVMMNTGNFMWMVYGYLTNSMPLMLANAITLLLAGSILALKLRNLSSE